MKETRKNLNTLTTLVLGESLNLTDTIMLFSYNPRTQEASMLSIPRDTFVGDDPDEATAWDKNKFSLSTWCGQTIKRC